MRAAIYWDGLFLGVELDALGNPSCRRMKRKLNFIHIGKCGGSTVRLAIEQSPLLFKKYDKLKTIHVERLKLRRRQDYLIVIRNPIDRAISAFNWRYHLVVETEKQRDRFEGEWQVLKNYSTLSSISENLYDSERGSLNAQVSREFRVIHHLHEDISFYLSDLLKDISASQVYGIIKQHSLVADCKLLLGPDVEVQNEKSYGESVDPRKKELSKLARRNLRRFLHEDFACILKLYNLGLLNWRDYELLTR